MPSIPVFIARIRYWCDVANMGYSQYDRWNFNPHAGNCDCSSLVIWCLREAGFDTGNATYTGNMSEHLTARGWSRIPNNGNPQPGDILLNDQDHVAVYVGNGLLSQASISETGKITGTPGDQTGGETNTSAYYNYPWNCYLRYTNPLQEENMPLTEDDIKRIWLHVLPNGRHARDIISDASSDIIRMHDNGLNGGQWLHVLPNGRHARDIISDASSDIIRMHDGMIPQLTAQVSALTAAVEAMAQDKGADPNQISNIVKDAVNSRLADLQITVTDKNKGDNK